MEALKAWAAWIVVGVFAVWFCAALIFVGAIGVFCMKQEPPAAIIILPGNMKGDPRFNPPPEIVDKDFVKRP